MRRAHPLLLVVALVATLVAPVTAPQPAAAQANDPLARRLAVDARSGDTVYAPGEDVTVAGAIVAALADTPAAALPALSGVPADFGLVLRLPDGTRRPLEGRFATAHDGTFEVSIPGALTADVAPTAATGYRQTLAVELVDVSAGTLSAPSAGAVPFAVAAQAGVQVDARFQSFTGWVKPGESFPVQIQVTNFDPAPAAAVEVSVDAPPGAAFTDAQPLQQAGTATVTDGRSVTWRLADVPAASAAGPAVRTLVVQARAASLEEDPRVVWKDLSVSAAFTAGGTGSATSHGPKVIPPGAEFETARYGDKRFPMVPVEFVDRSRQPDNTAEELQRVVNDAGFEGSTFNLYQEMSYGQLFPEGTVPSLGIAQATFSEHEAGFEWTSPDLTRGACRGTTLAAVPGAVGSPLFDARIVDGWYQLPGTTEYYGGDFPAFALGLAGAIDSACGQSGKAVFDAASAADPEIDYNDYDADKDGVVDFFMLLFAGCGGNGSSQLTVAGCPYPDAPYDNIWPHSSDLQMQYRDAETGLRGYTSGDQLTDLQGRPQCWVDVTYTVSDTCATAGGTGDDALPTFVRVGPYNVNPETAIDAASVISHEYGHYLGLPDFYSSYAAYGEYNLMAADYSQHMTVFSKQELGWVVPRYLQPGEHVQVDDWAEIKANTAEISWVTPAGEPYTLSAANGDQNVRNGEAYAVKLPNRVVIDPDAVAEQASPPTVFWSGRGNDFGCNPDGGHNLDIFLPELADLPAGTPVTLEFKSSWDIEWDWDYGFVLSSTDGHTYTSHPSQMGFTTPNLYNPNNQQCFAEIDNGLTGQSGSYAAGPHEVLADRNPVAPDYANPTPFLTDSYDLSALAGADNAVVRFSYFTDAAFDRPGWFIDDVVVRAGDEVIYSSTFERGAEDGRIFPGGCNPDGFNSALVCTVGWSQIRAGEPGASDHAYYLELRDRVGFDLDGNGQSDRGALDWEPGVFIEYTDESRGYGNNGAPLPPVEHYLNSTPEPGQECPETTADPVTGEVTGCTDWSFTAAPGRSHFDDRDNVQNFSDPSRAPREINGTTISPWLFDYNCLTLDVTRMAGGEPGPETSPADLSADATISAGDGCLAFDYARTPAGQPGPLDRVRRMAGSDRIGTAVALSRGAFVRAPAAVLATSGTFPDALSASALAAAVGGPILLNPRDELLPAVADELSRLGVATVYLVGGEAALSTQVEEALRAQRIDPVRVAGADRYATAAAILDRVVELGGDVAAVTVALGDRGDGRDAWPDALAAGNLAASARFPILLTRESDLPDATRAALDRATPDEVLIAGGTAAVSTAVEDALRAAGHSVRRVAGANRYATAVAFAEEAVARGLGRDLLYLASGANFPDALAAAPAAVASGGTLLLTDPGALANASATAQYLAAQRESIDFVIVAGGRAAVADAVLEQVRAALTG